MATAYGSTFTSTITESVTLNGAVRGSTNTVSINNINNVGEKIVTIPVSDGEVEVMTVIGTFAPAANAAKYPNYEYLDAKYCRVTNLSAEISIEVAWVFNGNVDQCRSGERAEAADSCRFLLQPGQSSIMWDTEEGKLGECTEPDWTLPLTNLNYIAVVNRDTEETADVELFIASD